ncbi:uncharacterized protein DS421_19g660270 [Arachis hypogaea]|uniref:Uncharacterized protein n=1 Tax=Arachis hypogaea TaxID=3818 RepID=A0A6B9V9Y4_ARAHY|nr:uncharacterized protein DS421_19g660270 [Arachis hypogaea]
MWLPGSPPELQAEFLLLETLLPSPENCRDQNLLPLPLEVAAELPLNRLGDRRCFGSAVPSSVRLSFGCCMLRLELLRLLRKCLGAKVFVAVSSG